MKMKATHRSKATGIYVFPQEKSYPIGDLFHARKAINMSLWPSNADKRSDVLKAVVKNYPDYDWRAYWYKKRTEAKNRRDIRTYHWEMTR